MEPDGHISTILVVPLRRRIFFALLFNSPHPINPPLTYGVGRPLYAGLEPAHS